MSRYDFKFVYCEQCCGEIIKIMMCKGESINKTLRANGVIVSKYGDFCSDGCLSKFMKERCE